MLTSVPALAEAAEPPALRTAAITLVTGDQVFLRDNAISPVPAKGRLDRRLFDPLGGEGH